MSVQANKAALRPGKDVPLALFRLRRWARAYP